MSVLRGPRQTHGVKSLHEYEQAQAASVAMLRERYGDDRAVHPAEIETAAFVSEGRWVAVCAECNNGCAVDVDAGVARCFECGAVYYGIAGRTLRLPERAVIDGVENILGDRVRIQTRNWIPGETLEALALENERHNVKPRKRRKPVAWTSPRTWVTGELVTASIMNTHVRDNLNMLARLDAANTFLASPQVLDISSDAQTYISSRNQNTGGSAYAALVVNPSGNSWAMRAGSSAANSNRLDFVVDALGTPAPHLSIETNGNHTWWNANGSAGAMTFVPGLPVVLTLSGAAGGTGNVTGNGIVIGRNTSGNGAAGYLMLEAKDGTDYYLWVDATGDLRVGTAPPQEDGSPSDTSGTVVGTQS